MRVFAARWLRILLLVASVAALAAEVVVITDAQIAKLAQQFGPVAEERLTAWKDILTNPKYKRLSEQEKLEFVNNFMNQTRFVDDIQHWGKEDYWATPIEFLSTNGGDCEDFSIAKYFTLRALGVPDEKLRITYVKELVIYNQAHMVLAYFPTPDSEPLVLDNINKTIQPASNRTDLLPVYSFNGAGLWLAKEQTGRGQSVGGSDRIGHWRDLQARMRAAM
ncbi:MAG: sulfate adenylyltransferase [Betaproteobacteria bacterium RIFCSPLOWO2_12_FULL_62_13]|nr:MAG: sulfate adenylyltransferase [Betaproteobacteria bacterium RIFCSPLOWO2_12_FULL_62_13]